MQAKWNFRNLSLSTVLGLIFSSSISFAEPREVEIHEDLEDRLKSFEPSASVYLPDLDRYLVASDDTTKKNDPWLFLINSAGQVEERPVVIQGLPKITDIESLSFDEKGFLYILSSQGLNKKGLDLPERNLFIKAQRQGRNIKVVAGVELRPLLLQALRKSQDPVLSRLRNVWVETLDIESHFIYQGSFFVGLKNPQPQGGHGLVLNLGSVDEIFKRQQLATVQIAMHFNFAAFGKKEDTLSEMMPFGNHLLLTTTTESGNGNLWSYHIATQKLQLLRTYKGFKPEGLAFNPQTQEITVFFDQGDEAAMFEQEQLQIRRRSVR